MKGIGLGFTMATQKNGNRDTASFCWASAGWAWECRVPLGSGALMQASIRGGDQGAELSPLLEACMRVNALVGPCMDRPTRQAPIVHGSQPGGPGGDRSI